MVLAAERSKHPRSGRPVCVHPEPGRGLGPDRSLAVVARRDLDVDAAAPPLGVGVLDLRIRVEHASLRVDGEAELSGGTVPLGVGGPATVSRTRGLAPARDSALEFAVEPYAPDGGAPLEQALAFAAGGDSLTDPAVERNDPGSGTGTLDIRADVDAFDEAGGLFTDFSVQVRDGIGEPVTGAGHMCNPAPFPGLRAHVPSVRGGRALLDAEIRFPAISGGFPAVSVPWNQTWCTGKCGRSCSPS